MPDIILAPWTVEQVEALNRFQSDESGMPAFVCGRGHPDNVQPMLAETDGFRCAVCDYRQDWAHDFMANPDAWYAPAQILKILALWLTSEKRPEEDPEDKSLNPDTLRQDLKDAGFEIPPPL